MKCEDIDGALVGGGIIVVIIFIILIIVIITASLNAKSFSRIIQFQN